MWRLLKRNETLSSLTWEMLAWKNIKKHKRLVLHLEALYLVKNIFCLYFSPIPKLWSRKKVIFKVFVFWRYSKTLKYIKTNKQLLATQIVTQTIFISIFFAIRPYSLFCLARASDNKADLWIIGRPYKLLVEVEKFVK